MALSFSLLVYGFYEHQWLGWASDADAPGGRDAVIQFVTGYLLEWTLSVDNIFVIAVIFSYMKIPVAYQYRVLFWGIVGAIAPARRHDRRRRGADQCVRLDLLRVRRDPALLRRQAAASPRRNTIPDSRAGADRTAGLSRTDELDGERFFTA